MHEVLVNPLGGLSLPRKSVVRLSDRPDMTLDVYCGHNATMQLTRTHSWIRIVPYMNTSVVKFLHLHFHAVIFNIYF